MNKLKPCPFCGSKAIATTKSRAHEWFIGCDGTYGGGCPGYIWKCAPVYFTKEIAIKAWNRRTSEKGGEAE